MLKRVGLIMGAVLLSIVLLGYVFRLPLLQWAVAPALEKAGVTLSCLDFSLTSKLNVHVQKACLSYQNQELVVTGITANTRHVEIKHVALNINPLPQSDKVSSPATILDLALPEKRPTITVEQLSINSEFLNQPLILSINEPKLNQFVVNGDLSASATLYNNKVQGQLKVSDELLKQLLKTDNALLSGLSFNTSQAFSFNGIEGSATGNLQARYDYKFKNCDISNNTKGVLSAAYNLNTQKLGLDSSKLKNNVTLGNNCQSLIPEGDYKAFAVKQLPLNWQWALPKPISLVGNNLALPLITLTSDEQSEQDIDITFTDTFVNTVTPLQSARTKLKAQLHTDDIKAVVLNTQLENAQLSGNYDITLTALPEFLPADANNVKAHGDFTLTQLIDSKPVGKVSTTFSFDKAVAYGTTINAYTGKLVVNMSEKLDANVVLKSEFKSVQYDEYKLTGINNTLSAKANLGVGELFAHLSANTQIITLTSPSIDLENINVDSKGLQSRALKASHHVFVNGIELVANHHISKVEHPFEVIVPQQNVLSLNSIISQFEPLAHLTQGEFGGRISGDVNLQKANFYLTIDDTSALYNDYLANQFMAQLSGQYDSGQLNVEPTTFNVNELRAGAVVNNINGKIEVINNSAKAFDVSGNVFGGVFELDKYSLLKSQQTANVTFKDIDASKLITLDDKSGITLTGRLKGLLPLHFSDSGVEVTNGSLLNQGEGKLIISNNAAFDSVMQQQQELQPVLSLLKNLDIQKLNSTVALKSDGWLNLGVNLQGFNELQQQQVNFNYNHEENVFTLLRALRLSDEITQKVELQYSQKGN
ncbi:YdbH domain-containing protein [Pseudoalteromonas carrageenovora]|uniref:YdbH domain-containing protein n=1 Tax=Pseudoalteromonas carrageenovora TaxID=227 RepID=UPI0026E14324|nr:YdbH domain-containing protein [Pseudoalteromonas carrageenovora]MDO6547839.1 YdbH domain-containing protein [Pseudoalteromonas carrageenovora]MDO6832304.1 YdbH domain-containing protein [Pseudoalteromonas carrageenovora]